MTSLNSSINNQYIYDIKKKEKEGKKKNILSRLLFSKKKQIGKNDNCSLDGASTSKSSSIDINNNENHQFKDGVIVIVEPQSNNGIGNNKQIGIITNVPIIPIDIIIKQINQSKYHPNHRNTRRANDDLEDYYFNHKRKVKSNNEFIDMDKHKYQIEPVNIFFSNRKDKVNFNDEIQEIPDQYEEDELDEHYGGNEITEVEKPQEEQQGPQQEIIIKSILKKSNPISPIKKIILKNEKSLVKLDSEQKKQHQIEQQEKQQKQIQDQFKIIQQQLQIQLDDYGEIQPIDCEINFWKVVKNQKLLVLILSFLSYDYLEPKESFIQISNVDWLIENGYRKTLVHKIMNNHYLELTDTIQPKGICSGIIYKLFKFFKSNDHLQFYQCLFKKFKNYFTPQNLKSIALKASGAGNTFILILIVREFIYQLDYYDLCKSISRGEIKTSLWIIKNFKSIIPNPQQPMECFISNYKNLEGKQIFIKNKLYKSIVKCCKLNEFKELSYEKQQLLRVQFSKRIFKLVNFISKNYSYKSSDEIGNKAVCVSLFNQCPVGLDVNLKWLVQACFAINSLKSFYINDDIQGSSGGSKKKNNNGNIQYPIYLINREFYFSNEQLSTISLDQTEYKKPISEINCKNENVKKLLKMFVAFRFNLTKYGSPLYNIRYSGLDIEIERHYSSDSSLDCEILYSLRNADFGLFKSWFSNSRNENARNKFEKLILSSHCNPTEILFSNTNEQTRKRHVVFIEEVIKHVNSKPGYQYINQYVNKDKQRHIHPSLFFCLVISYDNLDYIKLLMHNNRFRNKILKQQIPTKKKKSKYPIFNICKFIKSVEVLEYLYGEIQSYTTQAYYYQRDKFKTNLFFWDFQEWIKNLRIDLFLKFIEVSNKWKLSHLDTDKHRGPTIFKNGNFNFTINQLDILILVLNNPDNFQIDSTIDIKFQLSNGNIYEIEKIKQVIKISENSFSFNLFDNQHTNRDNNSYQSLKLYLPLFNWILNYQSLISRVSTSIDIIYYVTGRVEEFIKIYQLNQKYHLKQSSIYSLIQQNGDSNLLNQLIKGSIYNHTNEMIEYLSHCICWSIRKGHFSIVKYLHQYQTDYLKSIIPLILYDLLYFDRLEIFEFLFKFNYIASKEIEYIEQQTLQHCNSTFWKDNFKKSTYHYYKNLQQQQPIQLLQLQTNTIKKSQSRFNIFKKK